jgi:phosphoglycerol transferase MdoB-like AlkP superfamily enzyme
MTAWGRVRSALGPFAPLLLAFACGALFLSAMRLAFAIAYSDRISATPGLWQMFSLGLRMDTVLLCYLLSVPVLIVALSPAHRWRDRVVAGYLSACAFVLVYLELATPAFVAEYDKRPDRVFLEYLAYPREVLTMLWADHKLGLVGVPLAAALAAWLAWRGSRAALAAAPAFGWPRRAMMLPLMVAVVFAGCRSSLEPRPANISTASFSSNRLVNELTLNSTYTLAYAARSMRNEADAAAMYGAMAWPEVQVRVQGYLHLPDTAFAGPAAPIQHREAAAAVPRKLNLVILLEESLGAGFVGHLGGLPLTPNLDRLTTEGMYFTELHATGTRTARGMEAVVAGFPPSPSLSVLKLPGAQGGFFTLGAALRQQGYSTEFIYGGAANFDDMRAFYLANGFDRVIEQRDFVSPSFVATWGVSDEDLLTRANEEFRQPRDRPFFAVLMSSSNHDPFEIPDGRIEPYNAPLYTRENAIKYADYAIGRFFELARRESYYADTVFVVVADHDARVGGAPLVPLEHFRVPALVIGPGVPVGPYDRVASQIDLAPTLLGILGIDASLPTPGRNLMRLPDDDPGRAVMQYDLNYGFRVGNRMVVQQPKRPAQTFRIEGSQLVPIADDPELTRDALAHVLWPGEVYRRKLYRLPGTEAIRGPAETGRAAAPQPPDRRGPVS